MHIQKNKKWGSGQRLILNPIYSNNEHADGRAADVQSSGGFAA